MQSYKLHIVSEHSKDRHPYLEFPFADRYDPTEVTRIPSLLLAFPGLSRRLRSLNPEADRDPPDGWHRKL